MEQEVKPNKMKWNEKNNQNNSQQSEDTKLWGAGWNEITWWAHRVSRITLPTAAKIPFLKLQFQLMLTNGAPLHHVWGSPGENIMWLSYPWLSQVDLRVHPTLRQIFFWCSSAWKSWAIEILNIQEVHPWDILHQGESIKSDWGWTTQALSRLLISTWHSI